ncbi:hypothetical protein K4F52_005315 [Lecanicillium sp. MT-2017a]|nr:hypothetical protein K4F52_005315 [Lecanicillium sp. MT-2017a]
MSPISPTKLSTLSGAPRPRVLLIGAARQSPDYVALAARCEVITASSSRDELLEGLRTRKWSQVDAVLCTAAGLRWDDELVAALPPGLRLVAVEGDLDEKLFNERGIQSVRLGKAGSDDGRGTSGIQGALTLLDGVMAREKPTEGNEEAK